MFESRAMQEPSDSSAVPSGAQPAVQLDAPPRPKSEPEEPVRFLLIRQKGGALPWFVQALLRYMAPAQVVPVVGMANALWRLGHERFDGILLDVEAADRAAIARCREQIADVAAVPVLNLYEASAEAPAVGSARPTVRRRDREPPAEEPALRLPWLRRPKREPRRGSPQALPVS